jgi:hypothetical protein
MAFAAIKSDPNMFENLWVTSIPAERQRFELADGITQSEYMLRDILIN